MDIGIISVRHGQVELVLKMGEVLQPSVNGIEFGFKGEEDPELSGRSILRTRHAEVGGLEVIEVEEDCIRFGEIAAFFGQGARVDLTQNESEIGRMISVWNSPCIVRCSSS